MTGGSIIGKIIRFSIPLLIGNLLQQSYQLADMIIVGRCIDDDGLSIAAVGMGTSFIIMMISFFIGLSSGAGIVISNAYGAGNMGRVRKTIGISMKLSAAVSVVVCGVSILGCEWLLTVTHTTEEIFDLSATYLKIYAIGFIPLLVYNMGTSILQALGNSTSPFYYLAVTCVLNIGLDILFMKTFAMGVAGAAAATALSEAVATVLVLRKLFWTNDFKKMISPEAQESLIEKRNELERKELQEAEPEPNGKQLTAMIVRFGLPIAIQQVTVSLSNLILQSYINLLGTQVIAAWGIFGKIDGFLLLPLSSFSVAITTFTGQNFGAGKYDRILKAKGYVSIMSAGVTIGLAGLFILLARPIVLIFEDSPAIVAATIEMSVYMLPFYFVLALIRVYAGIFNGVGKPIYGSVAMISCMCVVRIACVGVVYALLRSAMAIYISYYVSWGLCLIVVMIEYRLLIRKMLVKEEKEDGVST